MGGCATKPKVLKDEADVPQPAEDPNVVASEPVNAETADEEKIEESHAGDEAHGQKSLGNLISDNEFKEENASPEAVVSEKKSDEETVKSSPPPAGSNSDE
ncbi:hypothetical protein KSP40_PGU022727 [Platanthera guangdongensis]|uniref:Uncharacterized protein n=1 Tax=Platanthera guangdongensis TaxID=2320717 RepID=A0ABR2M3Q2_9ASPA